MSPDRTRLAYVQLEMRSDIEYRTALVIRDLRTRRTRRLPLAAKVPTGTPPELVLNWSTGGKAIALFDGSRIRIVDVATAVDVPTQPELPARGLAPVFADSHTVVVLTGCCIGPQHLVAVELGSGDQTAFATLSSPVEHVRRIGAGRLLVITALHELAVVLRGHVRVIARRIVAAAP